MKNQVDIENLKDCVLDSVLCSNQDRNGNRKRIDVERHCYAGKVIYVLKANEFENTYNNLEDAIERYNEL